MDKAKDGQNVLFDGQSTEASVFFIQATLDALASRIAILDGNGTILAANAAWRHFASENDLPGSEFGIGQDYLTVVEQATGPSGLVAEQAALGIAEVAAGKRGYFWLEYSCPGPCNQRWYVMHVTRFVSPTGVRVVIAHEDITERKLAEQALRAAKEAAEAAHFEEQARRREAESRRQIAESLTDILGALNSNYPLDEILQFMAVRAGQLLSSQAVAIYHMQDDSGELVLQASQGLPLGQALADQSLIDRAALARAVWTRRPLAIADTAGLLRAQRRHSEEAQRDGETRPAETCQALLVVPIVVKEQIYGGILLYYTGARGFSEDEIELAMLIGKQMSMAIENTRLREQVELSAAIAERSRLARDLHDAVTQTLFSASVMAEALPRVWARDEAEGQRGLEELRQLTRGALAEMRTLLLELRPSALAEKSLGELLRHLSEAASSRTRVPITTSVDGEYDLLAGVKVALYRIAQEALNNIAKHADAGHVMVNLSCRPGEVKLSIMDDGRGFEVSNVMPDQLGLGIMRERAESIGADLDIYSSPGRGTSVEVTWQELERRPSHE